MTCDSCYITAVALKMPGFVVVVDVKSAISLALRAFATASASMFALTFSFAAARAVFEALRSLVRAAMVLVFVFSLFAGVATTTAVFDPRRASVNPKSETCRTARVVTREKVVTKEKNGFIFQ